MNKFVKYMRISSLAIMAVWFSAIAMADDQTATLTIEDIDAKIEAIQVDLIKAQAERFRTIHDITYENDALKTYQLDKSTVEKELIDVRRRYDERVYILDEGIRQEKNAIKALVSQNRDLKDLQAAISREIELAKNLDEGGGNPELVRLNQDLESTKKQTGNNDQLIKEKKEELEAREQKINARDELAGSLAVQIADLKAKFEEKNKGLGAELDNRDEVKALDEKRKQLAVELQHLQSMKAELLTKTPAAN